MATDSPNLSEGGDSDNHTTEASPTFHQASGQSAVTTDTPDAVTESLIESTTPDQTPMPSIDSGWTTDRSSASDSVTSAVTAVDRNASLPVDSSAAVTASPTGNSSMGYIDETSIVPSESVVLDSTSEVTFSATSIPDINVSSPAVISSTEPSTRVTTPSVETIPNMTTITADPTSVIANTSDFAQSTLLNVPTISPTLPEQTIQPSHTLATTDFPSLNYSEPYITVPSELLTSSPSMLYNETVLPSTDVPWSSLTEISPTQPLPTSSFPYPHSTNSTEGLLLTQTLNVEPNETRTLAGTPSTVFPSVTVPVPMETVMGNNLTVIPTTEITTSAQTTVESASTIPMEQFSTSILPVTTSIENVTTSVPMATTMPTQTNTIAASTVLSTSATTSVFTEETSTVSSTVVTTVTTEVFPTENQTSDTTTVSPPYPSSAGPTTPWVLNTSVAFESYWVKTGKS